MFFIALAAIVFFFSLTESALAQSSSTVGAIAANFIDNIWSPLWASFFALCFLVGLFLVISGLIKLKEAGERGQGVSDGFFRLFGGGVLLAIPNAAGATITTFYGITNYQMNSGAGQVGAVQSCLQNSGGITCVAQNIAQNMVPPFVEVSFDIMFMIGVFIIASTIYEIATNKASGRGDMPNGWFAKITLGALMANTPNLFYLISQTLGDTNATINTFGFQSSSSMLSYQANGGSAILQQYQALIGWVFQILVLFGVLSVWRGIMKLKSFADGSERSGIGSGLTHIVAGVLLANAKWTTCLVSSTMFGQGFGFCS